MLCWKVTLVIYREHNAGKKSWIKGLYMFEFAAMGNNFPLLGFFSSNCDVGSIYQPYKNRIL